MRVALLVSACLASVALTGTGFSQTADQPIQGELPGVGSDTSANGDSPAAKKASRDAIPFTPEMIEDLARRYRAEKQAEEQGTTELAAPVNRQVNVSFAPGAATSIVNTV